MRNYYITIDIEENIRMKENNSTVHKRIAARKTPKSEQPFNDYTIVTSVFVLTAFIVFMKYFHSL